MTGGRLPPLAEIVSYVALAYGIEVPDLRDSRERVPSEARAVVYHLARELRGEGWSAIGRQLNREHGSVLSGAAKIAARLAATRSEENVTSDEDRALAARVANIRALLAAGA